MINLKTTLSKGFILFRPYAKEYIFYAFFSIVLGVIDLINLSVLLYILRLGSGSGSDGILGQILYKLEFSYLIISIILLVALRLVAAIWLRYQIISFSNDVQRRMRIQIFSVYNNMNSAKLSTKNHAEAVLITSTLTGHFCANILMPVLQLISELSISAFVIYFLLNNFFILTIILILIFSALISLYVVKTQPHLIRQGRVNNAAYWEVIDILKNNLDLNIEVKSLGLRDFFLDKFSISTLKYKQSQTVKRILSEVPKYLLETLLLVGILLYIFYIYASSEKEQFQIILASLLGFLIAIPKLIPLFNSFGVFLTNLNNNADSVDRLHRFLHVENINSTEICLSSQSNTANEGRVEFKSISCKGVTMYYPGGAMVKLPDFALHKNGTYFITGSSGAGKTSLVKLISGLHDDFTGKLYLNQSALRDSKLLQSYSAICTQNSIVIDASFRDNIVLGRDVDEKRFLKICELLFPGDELSRVQNQLPKELSGGQKKRLHLARVLLSEKPILVLDEPTNGLHEELAHAIIISILDYFSDRAIIVISHDVSLKKYFQNIHIMPGSRKHDSAN